MAKENIRHWQIGDVQVTRIVEVNAHQDPFTMLSAGCAPDVGKDYPWLVPHFATPEGIMKISFQAFALRTPSKTIIVDTCIGADRDSEFPIFSNMQSDYLEDLVAAGYDPLAVDIVLCTHLHFDHVGWATQKGQVVFENATHHVHAADWDFFVEDVNSDPGAVRKLSPLQSRMSTFDACTTLAPGLDARPAVGHTPGSTVYVVSDAGERLVLLGDVAHHPLELTQDGWSFHFDHSKEQAIASRQEIVEEFANTPTLLAAGHFPDLRPGRLAGSGDALTWNTL